MPALSRLWIEHPVRMLLLALITLALTGAALTYPYARDRSKAIAYLNAIGCDFELDRPEWCPKWMPVPGWSCQVRTLAFAPPTSCDVGRLEPLAELQVLHFHNGIDDDAMRSIPKFRQLTHLYVRSAQITNRGLAYLGDCGE
ncbi:MAG TPA: hypothetical protein VHB77_07955, partial [Planctomycetaceae bacterium]|nr:hypothetical protein [Planctomycetaceae bacterium]